MKSDVVVASVTMGYGHLRAAWPIADALGVAVTTVDEPPMADSREVSLWRMLRRLHEVLSKPLPVLSAFDGATRGMMDALTMIPPLHEPRDHRRASWSVRLLEMLIERGLGQGLVEQLQRTGAALVTTFYAPAIVADRAGIERVYCVVTDADCNRVWAPKDAARTRIQYFAPSRRVVRRLLSFGVPDRNITLTGFPLPELLTESSDTTRPEQRLARTIERLDPRGVFRELHGTELELISRGTPPARDPGPIHLMFAIGGAGAQAEMADRFLPALRPRILDGSLRLQLVSGTRREVTNSFLDSVRFSGLDTELDRSIDIICAEDFLSYYRALNVALLQTDVLWTKPSEMGFYSALGLPCIIAPPVGAHERYNRRWLREQGAGLKQRRLDHALGWFNEWLEDGTLAGAAWSAYARLPKHGTRKIVEAVAGQPQRAAVSAGE